MSFIDEENYRMKRAGKKHKGIVLSSIAGTIVGASLFAFGAPLFSNSADTLPQAEASGSNMAETQGIKQISFVDAVDRASEAVVGVINIQRDNFSEADSEAGTGSGVIYKKTDGQAYIVTNNHVVGGANRIEVSLSDGKKVPGKVLGTDVVTDLLY